ncbi:MAG: glycosyltransferase [Candidatus Latescibacteria bacterium]|jgi:glycosyltransferase involved in cell wall biosynthesis|nr:glycosyltransferase [Candidatus Latescibacterota bacterium]
MSERSIQSPELTVLIPLFNEAESLPELYTQLIAALEPMNRPFELLFIDDGSRDLSFDTIEKLRDRDERVRAVQFRRNYGKSAALAVGFQEALAHSFVVTLDADLQDDPMEIPGLIEDLEGGFDLVSGWKQARQDPITKTLPSKFFNWVTSKVAGFRLHDFNCGLKAYRREVVETIPVYGELHRYLPVLAHWSGFRVTERPVSHHARKYGDSKFGLGRFTHGFFDLLTVYFVSKYTRRPLHWFGSLGMLSFGLGLCFAAYLSWLWLNGIGIGTRPLLLFSVLLMLLGIQLISMGLIGEMITHVSRKDEDYAVRRRLGEQPKRRAGDQESS